MGMAIDMRSKLLRDAQSILKQIEVLQAKHRALLNAAEFYETPDSVIPNTRSPNHAEHERQAEVLAFIIEHEGATPKQMIQSLGVPQGSLYRILGRLVNDGKIRKGAGKGAYEATQTAQTVMEGDE